MSRIKDRLKKVLLLLAPRQVATPAPASVRSLWDWFRMCLLTAMPGSEARDVTGLAWWSAEAMRKRDALLRAMAARYFAGMPIPRQAREICLLVRRYGADEWIFDCGRERMPLHYLNTPLELLFRLHRLGVPLRLSERRVRAALASASMNEEAADAGALAVQVLVASETLARSCG